MVSFTVHALSLAEFEFERGATMEAHRSPPPPPPPPQDPPPTPKDALPPSAEPQSDKLPALRIEGAALASATGPAGHLGALSARLKGRAVRRSSVARPAVVTPSRLGGVARLWVAADMLHVNRGVPLRCSILG
jgi:hypothetical protein